MGGEGIWHSPGQVVDSSGITKFEIGKEGVPVLMKEPQVEFVNDGPGKPVGINCFIGRMPIFGGWLYRPKQEILDGKWKFPEPQVASETSAGQSGGNK